MLSQDPTLYRALFSSIDQGCCIIRVLFDERGKPCNYVFEDVNAAFENLTGLLDARGRTIRYFFPDLDDSWFERYGRIVTTGVAERFVSNATPLRRWYEAFAVRIGEPGDHRVALVFHDITERKKTEDALRESEQRFRNMANNSPFMVWVTEADASCTFLSKSWYEFTGQTPETGLGFGWVEAVHPDDRSLAFKTFMAASAARESFALDYRLLRKDGEYRWAIDAAVPRLGDDGSFLGFIGSVLDITERRQAEDNLREADRRKDEFLATLAHELRNPLAPIRAGLSILRRAPRGESTETVHDMLERQLSHMVRLVDDLLEISRISGGKVELRKERVHLSTVLLSSIEISQPLIDSARHHLVIDLSPEPLIVEADAVRLAQVIANLLNNAAKYTDEGGNIAVRTFSQNGEAVVSVRDNGIGIATVMLPKVFELFTQAEPHTHSRGQGGLGIGLTLARGLAEMHGGTVEARSEGLGKGSEFRVSIPLAPDQNGISRATQTRDDALPRPRHRILVVDDNADAADSLGMLLDLLGAEAITAHSGPAALQLLQHNTFDAALLDIGMPDMDGHQLARLIRQRPDCANMTLIALTGWGQQQDRALSAEAGFDHHAVKPLDAAALEAILAFIADRCHS